MRVFLYVVCLALFLSVLPADAGRIAYPKMKGDDCVICIRDTNSGKEISTGSIGESFPDEGTLRWSPDGKSLSYSRFAKAKNGTEDNQMYTIGASSGSHPKWIHMGISPNILSDGRIMSYGSGIVFIGDTIYFKYLDDSLNMCAFPSGKTCALSLFGEDEGSGRIAVCDMAKRKIVSHYKLSKGYTLRSLDVSPDSKRILYAASNGDAWPAIFAVNLSSGKTEKLLSESAGPVAWSSPTQFYFVTRGYELCSYDLTTSKKGKPISLRTDYTNCLAYHK